MNEIAVWLAIASIVLTVINGFFPGWLGKVLSRNPRVIMVQRTAFARYDPTKPVRVILDGGIIQDIENIPGDITIEVYDYDTGDADPSDSKLSKDEKGDSVYITVWNHRREEHVDEVIR